MRITFYLGGIAGMALSLLSITCYAQQPARMAYGAVIAPRRTMSPEMIEALARYSQRMSDTEFQELLTNAKLSPNQAYLLPDWLPASFTLKDNVKKTHPFARYNIVLRRLELRDSLSTQTNAFYSHDELKAFMIGNEKQRAYNFELLPYVASKNIGPTTFFETVNTGAIRLLLLHELDIRPEVRNEVLNIEVKPAEYYRITRLFYLVEGQKAAHELALNRRSVLRIFGERAKEADAYAAEKHFDFTKLDDVLQLVEKFNVPIASSSDFR
ncbi:hypothetical protein HER32_08940 [Hymenobacter sp. BT18]|uniref:hypothetical protein n=1 Tax=Hymenobacter sp. BT18 TaxID=2835648 RepID=UPI00143E64EE|nr:hypothetical protein [Hymenobacter sp. BT18]QIX61299.1 hypothetical protein HER32_08940 [Hymenobacter sp. BT18]